MFPILFPSIKSRWAGIAGLTLVLGCAGCQSEKNVTHLVGGYEELKHPSYSFAQDPDPARISFQYQDAQGKIAPIWPALSGANEIIQGRIAIFVGDKAFRVPEKTIRPRLFAVQSPALPLDITDEILWRWSQANGKDFNKAEERFILVIPEQNHDRLILHLEFLPSESLVEDKDWPDNSDLILDWKQVAQIMQSVKAKGIRQKDLRWRTPYIGEIY